MDNEGKSNPFSCGIMKNTAIKRRCIFVVALVILFAIAFKYMENDKSAYSYVCAERTNAKSEKGNLIAYLNTVNNENLRIEKPTAITVDGLYVAALKSKKDALEALKIMLDKYKRGSISAYFKNDIRLIEIDTPTTNLKTIEEAVEELEGESRSVTYVVKDNDTLWSISREFNVTLNDIYNLNPDISERIYPGELLKIRESKPLLTVVAEKKSVYFEDIPYETVTQKDDKMFINDSKVLVRGKAGSKIVTAILKYYNGEIVNKNVINESVVCEPVNEVIAVGDKPLPATYATGKFNYPIRGHITITSRYGQRWGRLHAGIDIAASIGDPIYAADGGTVIFSGWESGYGYLVKIDHGNGYVTYYGHASKLIVKKGDKVYKGQEIALAGMTGNTTGPHVHFEVRKNGVPVNPQKYLK
ncbi:LysM peptidoglycan-binding domain-containing M23 family metallopeptidase [Thermoanaerobacterium butyriciformans]|uniref:Murein DD-endopeptidase MepM/ murein hydrolase activator NlpD n=1 Tax=Thermoanaerobacterium butyriciformans TaxID=1702242 RepID=A0ABS4NH84_9THEO|nr:peptidoglycan DD-metalloendopeptidase family protein [Thermoanaerobacterium butyriciformans]MBP2073029.1 murein DD-endopeptidase MepM/ murein hydrolase activator NlpD [Thermoanaerobacterium butyriciformans]